MSKLLTLSLAALAMLLLATPTQANLTTPSPIVECSYCISPDNGLGSADIPTTCSPGYSGQMVILDGLPFGSTIEVEANLNGMFDFITNAGGNLGGEVILCNGSLQMEMTGTGVLAGFSRNIWVPVTMEVHTAPRGYGTGFQDFDMELVNLTGQLFGDPDFCSFQVEAGSSHGLMSNGGSTLTRLGPPGSDFQIDSFFDIEYVIEFEGCPGSVIEGNAGQTIAPTFLSAGEAACDDGDACTLDYCDSVGNCVHEPIFCDDGLTCTYDYCDPELGCVFECEAEDTCPADLNSDTVVDTSDLLIFLVWFGQDCEP